MARTPWKAATALDCVIRVTGPDQPGGQHGRAFVQPELSHQICPADADAVQRHSFKFSRSLVLQHKDSIAAVLQRNDLQQRSQRDSGKARHQIWRCQVTNNRLER